MGAKFVGQNLTHHKMVSVNLSTDWTYGEIIMNNICDPSMFDRHSLDENSLETTHRAW